MTRHESVSRRAFLRHSSVLTAGVVSAVVLSNGCAPSGRTEPSGTPAVSSTRTVSRNPHMGYRRLGRTELMISEIVLGGHFNDPRGRHAWDRFTDDSLPADVAANRADVVSKCLDYGINYVDITNGAEAQAYGAALKGRRDRMYLAADDAQYAMRQDRNRNAESQMQSIESCLRKLSTDHLDIWRPQFSHTGGHRDIDVQMCIDVFERARQQGKVRFLGMSTHDRAWAQHAIENFPQYMVAYIPYTLKSRVTPVDPRAIDRAQLYEPQGQESWLRDTRKGLFETARTHDTGIITTKPFSAGLVFSTPPQGFGRPDAATEVDRELARLTLAYVLSNPDISGVAVGMMLPQHVDNNVRASFERRNPLETSAVHRLQGTAERMWAQLPLEYQWLRQWERV